MPSLIGILIALNSVLTLFSFTAGAVISGLPLLLMPPSKVLAILDAAFWHLRADGVLYQFTYGPRSPVSRAILDPLGLKATRAGMTLANVPPAMVYRICRRPALAADKKAMPLHRRLCCGTCDN
jgi:phospholipid N-methyltransferase